MAILKIIEWNENQAWASTDSWNLKAFQDRIEMCTKLHGTELKRIAKEIKSGKLLQLNDIDPKKAGPIIHTLESLGANIKIE